jgi:hypothetical protein
MLSPELGADMQRRKFITLLGGAAVAWPITARAQRPRIPVLGFLSSRSPKESAILVAAFQAGLQETGYVDGQNLTIEYRWAEGRYDRSHNRQCAHSSPRVKHRTQDRLTACLTRKTRYLA